jgi:hypothetical protein
MKLTTFTAMLVFAAVLATAQDQPKPQAVTPSARLAAAKTVFLRNGGGSGIPYDVVSSSLADWGRFAIVDEVGKADIIVEVTSPDDGRKKDEGGGGFGVSAQGKQVAGHRQDQPPTPVSTRNDVLMSVLDAKTKATLWSATEVPKGVEKGMSKEDKFVAAGARLMARFKERVEPPPPQ